MTGPGPEPPANLVELSESARATAWERWRVIAPAVADDASLTAAAATGGVPLRTAQRWLARYRADGLAGLAGPLVPTEAGGGPARNWSR